MNKPTERDEADKWMKKRKEEELMQTGALNAEHLMGWDIGVTPDKTCRVYGRKDEDGTIFITRVEYGEEAVGALPMPPQEPADTIEIKQCSKCMQIFEANGVIMGNEHSCLPPQEPVQEERPWWEFSPYKRIVTIGENADELPIYDVPAILQEQRSRTIDEVREIVENERRNSSQSPRSLLNLEWSDAYKRACDKILSALDNSLTRAD